MDAVSKGGSSPKSPAVVKIMDIKKGTRKEWTGPLIVTTRCYRSTNAQRDHRKRCTETSLLMTLWDSWEFISNINLPTLCLDMGQGHVVKLASICWPWLLGMATVSAHSFIQCLLQPPDNHFGEFWVWPLIPNYSPTTELRPCHKQTKLFFITQIQMTLHE